MARETIFEPQDLVFEYVEGMGYMHQITPAPFTLTVGETYTILMEEWEFTRTAFSADSFSPGAVAVGNAAYIGGEADSDNLPIIIGYLESADSVVFSSSVDLGTYSVGLYKEAGETKIILKDPDGNDTEYAMKPMIRLNATDGGTVLYSKGEIMEDVPVTLDFTAGDTQTITAPDGYLVKSAVIAKPTDLVPENVLKDKNIGGIIGTLEVGGEGDNAPLWTIVAQRGTRAQSTTISTDVSISLPKSCVLRNIISGEQYVTGSGSTAISSAEGSAPSFKFGADHLTVTEDEDYTTYNFNKTNTTSSTSYKWNYAALFANFTTQDFYISDENGVSVLKGESSLTALPKGDGFKTGISSPYSFEKVDLTQTAITSYYALTKNGDTDVKTVLLPESCTDIGNHAFYSNSGITKVGYNESTADNTLALSAVKTIGTYGCYYMKGIQYVELDACETLNDYAFTGCSNLVSVKLPNITYIGRDCFSSCSSLQVIDLTGVTAVPEAGNTYAIPANSGMQILVPADLYDEFIVASRWSSRADYIVAV